MRAKYIAGFILIALGAVLIFMGAMSANQSTVNAGIGGIFIGIVLLTFSTSDLIKYEAFKSVVTPYIDFSNKLVDSLGLKNKSIYIPPYANMPEGGIFIPLHEDFDIDLPRIDENTVFLTEAGREKEMGLVLPPTGKELVKLYKSYLETDFSETNLVESVSSVLRTLGLAKSVMVEEKNGEITVFIDGLRDFCSKNCEKIACPVCSSILLSIAEASNELVKIEDFNVENKSVKIIAKRIGGVEKWM